MPKPGLVILYVREPLRSAEFYSGLFGKPPVESSPTFVMLPLSQDMMLGLWAQDTVKPASSVSGGGTEIAISVDSPDEVRATHADWSARKLAIAQTPTELDFGTTFVALDPDGHRIRVFAPGPA